VFGKKVLRVSIAALILTAMSGSALLYTTYQKNRSYLNLLSDIPSDLPDINLTPPSDLNTNNLTPEYLEPIEDLIDPEMFTVSTGKFSDVVVKSAATGEELGHAVVLDVVTEDSKGNAQLLQIIVQIFLKSSPSDDLIPWLANIASFTKGLEEYSGNPKTYSLEELSQIFNENSVWLITPLVDFDAHKGLFARENQGYVFFARQYYSDEISTVKEFFDSKFEKGKFNRPLLLMTLEWIK